MAESETQFWSDFGAPNNGQITANITAVGRYFGPYVAVLAVMFSRLQKALPVLRTGCIRWIYIMTNLSAG